MRALVLLALAACGDNGTAGPVCDGSGSDLPSDVFCTGLYVDQDPTSYSPDVLPYTPGVVLWSDGAEKHRYLFLPPSTTIDTSDQDSWKFPVGTKVWKEFVVGGTRVETRLLEKAADDNWLVGTYIWDQAGSAATLNTDPHGIVLPSGYEIPTKKDCDKCHHGGSDKVLGVEAVALSLPTAQGETLARLAADGLLSDPPAVTTATLPEDATGKAGAALGYLHANCGMPCHSTRGIGDETMLIMRLRADEVLTATPADASATDTFKATVGQMPTTASVAHEFPGALRVTPGDHSQSLVWILSHRRDVYQMPPLITHAVDDVGTQTLADWIDAL